MRQMLKAFRNSHLQTKLFVLTLLLYMIALVWTTLQAYARLEYSRTGYTNPIVIKAENYD